ncbi:MAG: pyridoxamine 5'-phosphate oxidase family protein [Ilumatobacteraceae bacterium]
MSSLETTAPAFVEMAHRIVWATVATVDPGGNPSTRVLHPIWEWDGSNLTGWIATSPLSPKATHLASTPQVSITYWTTIHDTCTADCDTSWESSPEQLEAGWKRFVEGPAPVGYDPAIIPGWDTPESPGFGILRLEPTTLRVMPGTLMMQGVGELLTWKA